MGWIGSFYQWLKDSFKTRKKIIIFLLSIYLIGFIPYSRVEETKIHKIPRKILYVIYFPLKKIQTAFKKKEDVPVPEIPVIQVYKVELKLESPEIAAAGSIEQYDKAEIYPRVPGRIEKFYVKEGEHVKKGQKLYSLDKLSLQLDVEKQNAALESAKSQTRLAKEKWIKAERGIEARLKEIEKTETLAQKAKEEFEKSKSLFLKKDLLFKEQVVSSEELDLARTEMSSKEAIYIASLKDKESSRLGYSDEDIKKTGIHVPESISEKIAILKQIHTGIEKAEYEVAMNVLKSHEAQLRTAELMLSEADLYSPINGIVSRKGKSVGELATSHPAPEQSPITVIQIEKVYAVFYINEAQSVKVNSGMRVRFTADVYPDKEFTGSVILAGPVLDKKTHTIEVKALVENSKRYLKPGMFVRTYLQSGKKEEMASIPLRSVIPGTSGESSVFTVHNGKAFKKEIKPGIQKDDMLKVLSGLKDGDLVLLDGLHKIREGMEVNPQISNQ